MKIVSTGPSRGVGSDLLISKIIFGDGVEYIPSCFCVRNEIITSVIFPDSVKLVGNYAFFGCKHLKSVTIGNSVVEIEWGAFGECNPEEIHFKGNIEEWQKKAWYSRKISSCYKLYIGNEEISQLNINDSTRVKIEAFSGCNNIMSINVSPNNPEYCTIDGVLYNKTQTTLLKCPASKQGVFVVPKSVIKIGSSAFEHCTLLTSIVLHDGIKEIAVDAFYGCNRDIQSSVEGYLQKQCELEAEAKRLQEEKKKELARKIAEEQELQKQRELEEQKRRKLQEIAELEQQRLMEQQMQEMMQGSVMFFDTETTGVPQNYKAPITNSSNWPRLVQLAWIMADKNGNVLKRKSVIIKPIGFTIPADAAAIHGITTERALREGQFLRDVLDEFCLDLSFAEKVVGHNIDIDQHIVGAELYRLDMDYSALMHKNSTCTMKSSTDFCAIPNPNSYYGGYKWPSLSELYRKLFGRSFDDAHDALADVTATKECYFELKRRGI